MKEVFDAHLRRYPESASQDLLKLAYQSEFGAGHLISDPSGALAWLESEMAEASGAHPSDVPAAEPIGGGLCRLHLRAARVMGLRPSTVLSMFQRAAQERGTADGLNEKLDLLASMGMADAVSAYRAQGCPSVHHSEAYRAAYSPAYRLIPADCARILPVLARIDALMQEKPFVRVCIDGPCGSGKSTMAALIREIYDAALIPIDDFFLPPDLRTPERLAQPGGNTHYERFYEEVLSRPRDAAIDYRPYNCAVQVIGDPVRIEPNPLLIIEGSYSQHPTLRDHYDLRVLLEISPEEQSTRILRRNGPALHKRFIEEWIPLENKYFEGCRVLEHADILVRE